MIRLVIVDDHAIMRSGLKQICALAADLEVVAEASHGQALLALLPVTPVDLILLDFSMPGLHGEQLVRLLQQNHPGLPILMLSMHDEPALAEHMLQLGVDGFLSKDCQPETLLAAVHQVAGGGRFVDPRIAPPLAWSKPVALPLHEQLSPREAQVLQLLSSGHSIKHIGQHLQISAKTVSTHKLRVMEKLEVTSMAELMRYVIHHRLDAQPQHSQSGNRGVTQKKSLI